MDAIKGRAGTKCIHVDVAMSAQLAISGHHRPFAPPPNDALI